MWMPATSVDQRGHDDSLKSDYVQAGLLPPLILSANLD